MNQVSDMTTTEQLRISIGKIGVRRTLLLVIQKFVKKRRLQKAYSIIPPPFSMRSIPAAIEPKISDEERAAILTKADAMLADENYFFSFRYHLHSTDDPWNFDPLEKKYWPKRHYEETKVHGADTPSDVKIVWEINRFKDLPYLAQAAYLTKDPKYADEVERRILSWIECNPRGRSVNWSSPLEIAIRLISWTASLRLIDLSGIPLKRRQDILQSISEQTLALAANLSTDKIVRSNHLIGETTGLYIVSSMYTFDASRKYAAAAKDILSKEILAQTNSDGASKEASGWYHTFVTDFADIAYRTAGSIGTTFSSDYRDRLTNMYIYRNSLYGADGSVVKYGDFDNGRAVDLHRQWRDVVFGTSDIETTERRNIFDVSRHLTAALRSNSLFVRAGEFGWGGAGFSSHAHDDFLSPILTLHKHQILVDAGTNLYNGDSATRDRFRCLPAHNGIRVSGIAEPVPKRSFGWLTVRKDASIDFFSENSDEIIAEMSMHELRGEHLRRFILTNGACTIEDHFELPQERTITWYFHLHPRWRLTKRSQQHWLMRDFRGDEFLFELTEGALEFTEADYEYSSSYRDVSKAKLLTAVTDLAAGTYHYRFEITRAS
jgi:hypothetical protein